MVYIREMLKHYIPIAIVRLSQPYCSMYFYNMLPRFCYIICHSSHALPSSMGAYGHYTVKPTMLVGTPHEP